MVSPPGAEGLLLTVGRLSVGERLVSGGEDSKGLPLPIVKPLAFAALPPGGSLTFLVSFSLRT